MMKKISMYYKFLINGMAMLTFTCTCSYTTAQVPDLVWAKQIKADSTNYCIATGIVTDYEGYIYTTGYFTGTVDFDPGPGTTYLTSVVNNTFITKFDSSGTLIWVKEFKSNSGGRVLSTSIAIDNDDNLYLTGTFEGSVDFDPSPGVFNLSSVPISIFVCKLNKNGDLLWAKMIGESGTGMPYRIATDQFSNIYFCGRFAGKMDFDPGPGEHMLVGNSHKNGFVAKFDFAGNFKWAYRTTSALYSTTFSLTVGLNGYIYTVGQFREQGDFDPGINTSILTSAGGEDIFITKMDTAGKLVWAKQIGGIGLDGGTAITVDKNDNIYVTGVFEGTADFNTGQGVDNLTAVAGTDIFILKMNAGGGFVWAKKFTGSQTHDAPNGILLTSTGDIIVTGWFWETTDFNPGTDQYELTANNGANFISCMSPLGNFLWAGMTTGFTYMANGLLFVEFNKSFYGAISYRGIADIDPGLDSFKVVSSSDADMYVFKLGSLYLNLDLGPDTVLCTGDTLHLSAKLKPQDQILWSTGDTTPTLTVTQSGTYHITVTADTLTFADTVEVVFAPKPTVYIGPDTAFCGLVDHLLQPQTTNAQKFQWNTGDTTKTLHINNDGTYSLTVSSEHSCHNADTVFIDKIDYPYPPGQQDTTICGAGPHTLDAKNPGSTYQWSTGETSQTITVTENGLYSVTISNGFCSIEDSVQVEFLPEDECEMQVFVPNAFTPAGKNPIFKANGQNVSQWSMKVFSRWGELLFTTTNFAEGWDGTYKGIPCPEGVYVYIAEARGIEGEKKVHKGNVMLMR